MTWIYISKRLYTVIVCMYTHCVYTCIQYAYTCIRTCICYLSIWGLNMSCMYMYVYMYTSAFMCMYVYVFSVLPCTFNFCKLFFKVICHKYTHTHISPSKDQSLQVISHLWFYYHWFHYCRTFRLFLNFLLSETTL